MNKLTLQNKWILAAVAFVLINVLVWYFGLSPTLNKIQAAQNQLAKTSSMLLILQPCRRKRTPWPCSFLNREWCGNC